MANIMDYLDWRGDISLEVDPFNEVDSLILSELAYVRFDGVLNEGFDEICTLAEASERFFELHGEEDLEKDDSFVRMMPLLMRRAAGTSRFRTMRLTGYVNVVSEEDDQQMAALTFLPDDGSVYVAFRGTDNSVVGWKEDFNLSFMTETPGQRSAAEYLKEAARLPGEPFRVGGHSKGGNFAVFASSFCDAAVQERIDEVYTNDGPGFLPEVVEKDGYKRVLGRIRSIIPAGSIFGLLLRSGYSHEIVASSEKGIQQHDGMSWQVIRNGFVKVPETTRTSIFMEKTLDNWIRGIPMDERKAFVDAFFDLIDEAGIDTAAEFTGSMKKKLEMLKSFPTLPEEEQKVIKSTLAELIKSGVGTLTDNIKSPRVLKGRRTHRIGTGLKKSIENT